MPLLKLGEKRYYLGIFFKVSFYKKYLMEQNEIDNEGHAIISSSS